MNESQQKEQKEQKIEIGPQHHEIPELSSPANGAILLSMFKDTEFRLENFVREIKTAERSRGGAFQVKRESAKALRQEQAWHV